MQQAIQNCYTTIGNQCSLFLLRLILYGAVHRCDIIDTVMHVHSYRHICPKVEGRHFKAEIQWDTPFNLYRDCCTLQPGDNPPALKPWGFSPTMEVVQPVVQQPQVVFLQPVVSHRASSSISKDTASRHRHPKKYLPILKSYPKIAPHPGDSSSGRGSASSFSSSSSSSGSERSSSLASSHRERNHRDKQRLQQQKNVSGGSSSSGSTTASLPASPISLSPLLQRQLSVPITDSSASSSPASDRPPQAISRSEFTPSPYLTPANGANNSEAQTLSLPPLPHAAATEENGGHDDGSDPENKRKRFCNTYNILSKSGLLDITLRTKELLRQNRRTQVDLDRLKEHTNLFLQALQSGDTSIWGKLQASLQEEDKEKEKERCTQNSLKAD